MDNQKNKLAAKFWSLQGLEQATSGRLLQLSLIGFLIGLLGGCVVSVFRIVKGTAYNALLVWMTPANQNFISIGFYALFSLGAALVVCWLIKNPALRLGGEKWIDHALEDSQPHPWYKILIPKFVSTTLVLAAGISVGSEGPSIQMGAAAALGLKKFTAFQPLERRFFILAGSAAGLAAAFCAPFAGICYVYEIMGKKLTRPLFTFMLASAFGVYVACYQIFQLGTLLPLPPFYLPDLWHIWMLVPLALVGGLVGMCYTFLLDMAVRSSLKQKLLPLHWLPVFAFAGAFLIVLFFPEISGEGLDIFIPIEENKTTLTFLLVVLAAKLLFTAFCYGTFIPAGVMVPLISIGGVTGAIYFDLLSLLGITDLGLRSSCVVLGMASAFAASELAPVTAVVLVAEMSGAWSISAGLLLAAAIGYFITRLFKISRV